MAAAAQKIADGTVTLLIGDIGGTNARLELFSADLTTGQRAGAGSVVRIFPTADYETFQETLRAFLCDPEVKALKPPAAAAIACAGPVTGNACRMTNLKWIIDGEQIEREFGFATQILNDFEALGYGIPALTKDEVVPLNDNAPVLGGPIAVLGPGTGLGEAQLMWDTGLQAYRVWPSEGSHADFAPRGSLQWELLQFAEEENDLPCELEHVACGSGLKRIYRFLCAKNGKPVKYHSPAEVSERGLSNTCSVCSQAVDIFLDIIGAEAGHMALRCMASGGVYIAGGITPKLISRIRDGNLLSSFENSRSRFSKVISQFPLFIVMNDGVGLKGASEYAIKLAQRMQSARGDEH